jgi:hypothetical protein
MSSSAELDVLYKVGNAPVRGYPFPHFYVPDVFPAGFYAELQRNLPRPEHMKSLEEARKVRGYPERSVLALDEGDRPAGMPEAQWAFWRDLAGWLRAGRFGHLLLQKFAPVVEPRLQGADDLIIVDEALLVHDRTQYSLGPHTDSPRKLVTLLFYLPADAALERHGTSIYVPKDPAFTCPGGPHYGFEKFERMATMPFRPNALFAFAKTDNSFHGVEPFDVPGAARWLLLFDLYLRRDPAAAKAAPAEAAPGQPSVQFKF